MEGDHNVLHHDACCYAFHHGDPNERWSLVAEEPTEQNNSLLDPKFVDRGKPAETLQLPYDDLGAPPFPSEDELVWLYRLVHDQIFSARGKSAPPGTSENDIYRPEVMKTIEDEIEKLNSGLRDISMKIHGSHYYSCLQWSEAQYVRQNRQSRT